MSKRGEIGAAEAHAFLNVVAPRLEQLRRRLAAAKDVLQAADPERGRIEAILESQLALKEFLSALPDFRTLVEPIDVLLEAVREEETAVEAREGEDTVPGLSESEAETDAEPEPAPNEIERGPEVEAPLEPAPLAAKAAPDPVKIDSAPDDVWLQVGTAIALEKLTNAGMATANAEFYVEQLYATVGLRASDGAPISLARIKEWRTNVVGPGAAWRRRGLVKRRAPGSPGKGPASLPEVKARVDEIAVMFKKMAPWAAASGQGRAK